MRRVARWCVTHRLVVVGAWIAIVFATVFISSSTGSNYSSGNSLSGTPSATAQNLLKQASAAAAGDSEQIVFATHGQSVSSPAVRAQITPMLARWRPCPTSGMWSRPTVAPALIRSAVTGRWRSRRWTSPRTPTASRPVRRPRSSTPPGPLTVTACRWMSSVR